MNANLPNTKILRKLEVWKLICRNLTPEDIANQLIAANALRKDDVATYFIGKRPEEKIEALMVLVEKANKSEKIYLLDYEWQILPLHMAKVTVVTPDGQKEFEYVE
jgi:hypothetical protein